MKNAPASGRGVYVGRRRWGMRGAKKISFFHLHPKIKNFILTAI